MDRNQDWNNEEALYKSGLKICPLNAKVIDTTLYFVLGCFCKTYDLCLDGIERTMKELLKIMTHL